jgi:hypothetical protein
VVEVTWRVDFPDARHSTMTGQDEAGNVYQLNACREVVTVRTLDGRMGEGWTAGEALRDALSRTLDNHPAGAHNKKQEVTPMLTPENQVTVATAIESARQLVARLSQQAAAISLEQRGALDDLDGAAATLSETVDDLQALTARHAREIALAENAVHRALGRVRDARATVVREVAA